MNTNDRGDSRREWLSRFLSAFGLLLLLGLTTPTLAQPLFTITAQTRTVSAGVVCGVTQQNTASSPDFGNWSRSISASASQPIEGGFVAAGATQVSNIFPDRLSGCIDTIIYQEGPCAADATVSCSLTFSITRPLWFYFDAVGFASSFSLSGQFEFGLTFDNMHQTREGQLAPGTYTFTGHTFLRTPSTETSSGAYSLLFSEIEIPFPTIQVVAGPFTRSDGCHRYLQLAPSNWTAAETRAVQLGGHLVTINNAAEQAWLESTFAALGPPNKFIGLRLRGSTYPFLWESGQNLSYQHWAPSFPRYDTVTGWYVYYGPSGLWNQSHVAFPNDAAGGIVEVEGGCRCDWDLNGLRDSQDFFAFLSQFFAGGADFDCSGSSTSTDFFQFLTCFHAAACP
ncbi:MAG: hypothetical protein H7210_11780 [Pyrinomonadaceae bacterium]|nr:hypothetical protein [Phycisphaerales bacterium]